MARAWPPMLMPTPNFQDRGLCIPGTPLSASAANVLRTKAACAIQSWSALAATMDTPSNCTFSLPRLAACTNLYTKIQSRDSYNMQFVTMPTRMGPQADALIMVLCVFDDLSAAVLVSDAPPSPSTPPHFRVLPRPLKLANKLTVPGYPLRTLKIGNVNGTNHLYFPRKGDLVVLNGADPAGFDTERGCLYVGIIDHAAAWARTLDLMAELRPKAPHGPDWGVERSAAWCVPPCLQHAHFSPQEADALHAHLDHAMTLIWAAIKDEAKALRVTIQAGSRTPMGKATLPQYDIAAYNTHGHLDSAIQRKVHGMFQRALKLPSCPVPSSRLLARALYASPKKKGGKGAPPVLMPQYIYQGLRHEPDTTHRRMSAIAAIGRDWL